GPLPSFESLTLIPRATQTEFRTWVTSVQDRVAERDEREQKRAAAQKRAAFKAKATRYADLAAASLPAEVLALKDGSECAGKCAACGEEKRLRLTKFEGLAFGLCVGCYFSKAW